MTPEKQSEMLEKQLLALLGLYEHHLDLFLKWMTLYATVVGGIAVYIFNQQIDMEIRRKLPLIISAGSLLISFASLLMWNWLRKLERDLLEIADKLEEKHYPSLLGITMTLAAFIVTLLFSLGGIIYSIYGKF